MDARAEWARAVSAAAAPLNVQALFRDLEASGDWDVEEALFLTFNADVGFFERGVLGLCRSMGARVTVIADAGMWHPDPLTMKGAGTEYLVGLAAHRGAFHPKLALLVGEDRVLALVGSGNLTMGGWQHNSELWSVLRAEDGQAPQALFALAEWLELLPVGVRFASDHAGALTRVAARLRSTLDRFIPVDDGAQLITNLDRSVLSQLPAGPVDELTLSAPFIDGQARAVRALVEHFPTSKLTLVTQPGLTVVEPHALASVLSGHRDLRIVADNSRRYRHAKLVEWRRGPDRQALTGSANLSAAAMLNTVERGGNVELGLLTTIDASLWPDPQLDLDHCVHLENVNEVPAVRIGLRDSGSTDPALPQLLSAVLSGNELVVELAYPILFTVEVHYTNNPLNDAWKLIGTIIAGERSATLPAGGLGDNALLRLNWAVSDHALPGVGPAVPASVPERLRMRPTAGPRAGSLRIRTRDDLLGDDLRYLAAFASQLSQIHDDVAALRNLSTRPPLRSPAPVAARDAWLDEAPAPWLWEHEQSAQRLHGPTFSGFALGLPAPVVSSGWESFDSDETGELDADGSDLYDDDHAGAASTEILEPDAPLSHANSPEKLKKARRDRIRSFAEMSADLSTISYLGLTRLALCFYCAGNWEERDAEPIRLITSFLSKALDRADSVSLRDEANALAAVALTCVRRRVDYTATTPATQEANKLHERCSQLELGAVSLPLVTEYTQCLSTIGGRPLEAAEVYDELQTFAAHPLLDAVIMAAEGHGYDAEVLGPNSLQLSVRSRDPLQAALKIVPAAKELAGIRATSTTTGKSAIVLWSAPDLYCIEPDDPARWVHYRSLQGLNLILAAIRSHEDGRFRVSHGPFKQPIAEAKQLAENLGLLDARQAETPQGVCGECFVALTPAGVCGTCEP